jgi:hypothetical protein
MILGKTGLLVWIYVFENGIVNGIVVLRKSDVGMRRGTH